jgi:hypothetical protein
MAQFMNQPGNEAEQLMAVMHMVEQNRDVIMDLTEKCTDKCVSTFYSKTLNREETKCIDTWCVLFEP